MRCMVQLEGCLPVLVQDHVAFNIDHTFHDPNRQDHPLFLALCAQVVWTREVCKSSAGALARRALSDDIRCRPVLRDTVVLEWFE